MKMVFAQAKSFYFAKHCNQKSPDGGTGRPACSSGRRAQNIMYYVYALKSLSKKYIYVGLSNNVQRRVSQHQDGKEKTTSAYRPFEVILIEKFLTRIEAREREKYLKSGCGKEFLKQLK